MITKKAARRVAKPVVLIAEELSPATLDALGPDFEVVNCDGADRGELLAALAKGVDAVLIRSATKMDAEAIAAEFKGKVTFCGGIDVQYFIVNNTPAQVEKGIQRLIEIFDSPDGGFIIAPANSIMPETPLENVQAMFRAMRAYGLRGSPDKQI